MGFRFIIKKVTATIILAAGKSRRMGQAKLLIKYQGQSLLKIAIDKALRVSDISYLVVGANKQYLDEIKNTNVIALDNPDWNEGLASSLRLGIAALDKSVEAVLIILPDQPLVEVKHLKKLIAKFYESDKHLVYSKYQETLGVPAVIGRKLFAQVLKIKGDKGARVLAANNEYEWIRLEHYLDIDTPEDYSKLKNMPKTD